MAVLLHLIKAAPDFLYDWVAGLTFGEEAVSGRLGKSEANTPA